MAPVLSALRQLFPAHLPPMTAGDWWAGLAASALLLPQAMAFGIALWLPITHDAGAAALSGLLTTVWLCAGSALMRGTQGVVSAPTGPSLVLIAGSAATFAASGLSGSQLVTAISLVILAAGVFDLLIAFFGLGRLIKFIPYPVISGFMSGSALLMIWSQRGSLIGKGADELWQPYLWIPLATAAVTFGCMHYLPRWIPQLPNTVLGLVGGTLSFYLFCHLIGPGSLPAPWVVGHLPSLGTLGLSLANWALAGLPLTMILTHGLALSLLTALNSLLVAMVADLNTSQRSESRLELAGLGIGHLVSALTGGTTGSATTGATMIAIKSGGRHWGAFATSLIFLLIILFFSPVAALLPISVFAGIILYVAIINIFDRDMLLWLASPHARLDGAIALLVTGVTVFYDLIIAIAVGLILAVVEFIRTQTLTTVIHQRCTLENISSMRRRTAAELALLRDHADGVVLYELKGNLFFGTADHLIETMKPDFERPCAIVLDMRRVSHVDLTARHLLEQMVQLAQRKGGTVFLAHPPKELTENFIEGSAKRSLLLPSLPTLQTSNHRDTDEALEAAENSLLARLGSTLHAEKREVALNDFDLFRDFRPDEMNDFLPLLRPRSVEAEGYLFHAGERGDSMFFLLHGEVDMRINYRKKQRIRLAKFGPGTFFGEVSLLEPGLRSADAKAESDLQLLELTQQGLAQLKQEHPHAALKLLTALGREASRHLRWANLELQRLARE